MIHQSNDMLSGLERELELYMGEEYESKTLPVRNTDGDDVTITLQIDASTKTGSITVSAYNKKDGTPVSASTITLKEIKKVDDKTVIGMADEIEGYKNVLLKMQVDDSPSAPKLIAAPGKKILGNFVAVPGQRTYAVVGPSAQSKASELAGFIKSLNLAQELELEIDDDEYEFDPTEDAAGRMEHFLPFFNKPEDTKTEILKLLETTDQVNVNVFVVALQKKIEDWKNKVDPFKNLNVARFIVKGLESIDLSKAQQLAILAYVNLQDRAKVVSYVGMTLDALLASKDIVIIDGILKIFKEMKKLGQTPLQTLKKILKIAAKTTYKRFTKSAEIEKKLAELEALLLSAETMKNETTILARIQQAQAKLQEIELLVLEGLKSDNELEYEEDDEMNDEDEMDEDEMDDDEHENDDDELDDDEFDDDDEFENELNTLENEEVTENFARRLYELSTQSFESAYELDMELDRALDAVENEYMVKRLRRKHKRGKGKGLFGKILSTGAKIIGKVASATPVGKLIKAGTSLVRGDVKGAVKNLAQAAIGTVAPGVGTVANAAIDALGSGEEGEVSRGGRKRRAMHRVARIARDAYREVADTLPEDFDHPLVAHEVASKAVQKAMVKNGVRPPAKAAAAAAHNRRIIQIRPGEKVVIVRA